MISSPIALPISVDPQHMLVIFNPVHHTRRDDFILFMHDVLIPAVRFLDPAFRFTTRLLEPQISNVDGSYTYVLLIDPAFHTQDTPAQTILSRAYGAASGREHLENYLGYLTHTNIQFVLAEKVSVEGSS